MNRALLLVLAALAGCRGQTGEAPAPPGVLPASDEPLDALSRRHSRLRERMERRGYREVMPRARLFVLEDRPAMIPVDLPSSTCTTLVALGTSGVRDLRLSLFDEAGEPAVTSEAIGEGGLLHICPESGSSRSPFYFVVDVRDGAGSVAVSEFRSAPSEGEGFVGLWDDILAPRAPFSDVEARMAETRTALRARGWSLVEQPPIEWLSEGGAVRVPVRFEAGQCYVAVARAGPGARDVDIFLFDPSGVEIERDLGSDAEPSVEHCPESSGRFVVESRVFEGEGALGVMILGAAAAGAAAQTQEASGQALEVEPSASPDVSLGVTASELAGLGVGAPLFVVRDAAIAPGETRTHEVAFGAGCTLILAAASHDGMDVDLYLADTFGRARDSDTAVGSTARVRACTEEPAVLRVAVKAYGRDGRYALAALRATDARNLEELRLLESMASPHARGFREVERWSLEVEENATLERALHVSSGTCLAVAAAGSAGIEVLDLHLLDRTRALLASDVRRAPLGTVTRCSDQEEDVFLKASVPEGHGSVSFVAMTSIRRGP